MHKEMVGEYLKPSQANDRDEKPYVYASSTLKECLPYATPNGTRIANVAVPCSDDFLTIIPDRQDFLKNGCIRGTLYRFSSDNFQPQFLDNGELSTQWISEYRLHHSKMERIADITSIDDVMEMGLHVLFTNSTISESYQFIEKIVNDEAFPNNLKSYVNMGVLTYENQLRSIKPNALFTKDLPSILTPSL